MRTEPSFSAEPDDHYLNASVSGNSHHQSGIADSQILADYRQHYGLSVDPFADDPHFPFYTGAQRRLVLDKLLHLCQFSHNLLVVAGEYGTGKTRMAQALIDALDDKDDICFLEGQITSDFKSLLNEISNQLEVAEDELSEFYQKKSDDDGLFVLIVDNAHHLTDAVIAELISLLNADVEIRLHLVLLAEPHLLDRLDQLSVPNVEMTDFFLEKFSLSEAVDYLNFRMEMADYLGPEIFSETKVEPWWRQSQGQLLTLHEYAQEKLLATVASPRTNLNYERRSLPVPHIIAASVLIAVLFLAYFYFGSNSTKKNTAALAEPIPASKLPVPTSQPSLATSTTPIENAIPQPISAQAVAVTASSQEIASTPNVASNPSSLQTEAPVQIKSAPTAVAQQSVQPEMPVVKQSVVPLVKTNSVQSDVPQKASKSSVAIVAKEIKKVEPVVEAAKPIQKSKHEEVVESKIKSGSGFSDQEKAILSWDASEFTLQLVGVSSEKSAREFIAEQQNKKDLLLFKSIRQGKDWFVVVTGTYATSAKARQAAQLLPESQRKASPWPRDIKTIQNEIRQR